MQQSSHGFLFVVLGISNIAGKNFVKAWVCPEDLATVTDHVDPTSWPSTLFGRINLPHAQVCVHADHFTNIRCENRVAVVTFGDTGVSWIGGDKWVHQVAKVRKSGVTPSSWPKNTNERQKRQLTCPQRCRKCRRRPRPRFSPSNHRRRSGLCHPSSRGYPPWKSKTCCVSSSVLTLCLAPG